ncbi:RNA-directed DNA polymerase, eukaryota, reverse transcriptase zinc-binding domain protein [Tanacetum coccineum]
MNEDKKDIGSKDNSNSYAHAVKGCSQMNREAESNPALVLDESCVNKHDYSCCLNGKVKDFGAVSNLKVVLGNEGFDNIVLRYLGGLWVMIEFTSVEAKEKFQSNVSTGTWFSQLHQASNDFIIDGRVTWVEIEGMPLKVWSENTFKQIASKWGALFNVDDPEEGCLHKKRLCIYMTGMSNIFESFKLIYKGKAYWVRAKEVPGWIPDFVDPNDEDSESDDEYPEGDFKVDPIRSDEELEGENETTVVPDTEFEKENPNLKYPPGFTPGEDVEAASRESNQGNSFVRENGVERKEYDELNSGSKNNQSMKDGTESVVSGHFKKTESPRTGGSILLLMEELIKGLTHKAKKDWVKELCVSNKVNFLTLQETKMESIELFDIKRCWGNFAFDYVNSASVGNFWEDVWRENMALKHKYPRLYELELNKNIEVVAKLAQTSLVCSFRRDPRSGVEHFQLVDLLAMIEGVSLGVINDRWTWALEGSEDFSVASVKKLIDDKRLPVVSSKTRWIKAVPIKVNVHAWKLSLDCLSTRLNISRIGLDIESILCPICGIAVKSSRHLFFDCHVAKDIFCKICRWWDVDFMEVSSYEEWSSWILNIRVPIKHKRNRSLKM